MIQKNIPKHVDHDNLYDLYLVNEMIGTLSRLKYGKLDQKEIDYIKDNFDDLVVLGNIFERYYSGINQKLNEVEKRLNIKEFVQESSKWRGKGMQRKLVNVLFFRLIPKGECENLQLKIRLSAKGWSSEIWNTKKLSTEIREQLKNDYGFQLTNKDEEYLIFHKMDFNESFEEVKESVEKILGLIYV